MSEVNLDEMIVRKFKVKESESLPLCSEDGTRNTIAEFMGEVGFKTGAEIGVLRGAYSECLCANIPNLKLKCIDPWMPFRRNSSNRMEQRYIRTCRRLRRYDAEIIRKTDMEALSNVADESLDFIYIDAMHEFDPVMLDLILWSAKVRSGGIVAGHDYVEPTWCNGVKPAVDAYTKAHGIEKWYVTREIPNDSVAPSYFWVKP